MNFFHHPISPATVNLGAGTLQINLCPFRLRRWHGWEAVVARLGEPAGPVLVVDLGGGFAPFFAALEQTGADHNLILAWKLHTMLVICNARGATLHPAPFRLTGERG